MLVFQIKNNKLAPIKEKKIMLEKDLQQLVEANLETLFGLEFLSTEFEIDGLYIDTVAFDPEKNSFIIIEYKKDKSFTIVDQGFSYLSLMLNHKADFILEYNEKLNKNLKRGDIDWSQAKVVFIAKSFTRHQQNAINFKNMPFELWEASLYDTNLLSLQRVDMTSTKSVDIKLDDKVDRVVKEVKNYSEKEVLGKNKKIWNLYQQLKEKISLLNDEVISYATKHYVGYRLQDNWRVIFSFKPKSDGLEIGLTRSKPSNFKDPEKKIKYTKNSMKHFNQHLSYFYVKSEEDIDYAQFILSQAIERFLKEYV